MPTGEEDSPEARAAEADLYEFSRQAWSIVRPGEPFTTGWVFGCMCEHAQALVDGYIKKLAVAVPPRHGKSLVFNVFMPVWSWIKKPSNRYIFTAYSDTLVVRDSLACRDLIRSPWFQKRWGSRFAFKSDQNRQDQFTNNKGGFRLATTPGGTATGEGAHGIIADDIISVQNSFSAAAIESAWKYWTQTMALRFENPEDLFRLVTMQRLRKNDLIGRLIAEKFDYDVLTLPFEAEPHRVYSFPDPMVPEPKHAIIPTRLQRERPHLQDNRKHGEILWPERFRNPATIADLRKSVQAGAAGQLQQRPENDAGAVFKESKFKLFYPRLTSKGLCFLMDNTDKPRIVWAKECAWYQTCDTAMKAEQQNDECAFATFAKSKQGDLLVFHAAAWRLMSSEQWPVMKHFRVGMPEWDEAQREVSLAGKMRPWPEKLMFQSVEGKNSGITLLQLARSEGYPLKELEADTNKVLRAATAAQLYESGHIYHNAEGDWRGKLEDQLGNFPGGKHDDMVDVISYGAILFVHDNLLAAYTGPLVYNDRVHQELEAIEELNKANDQGQWIPPALRPQLPDTGSENLDELLAALQGRPIPRPPVVDDVGRLRPEFLHDED